MAHYAHEESSESKYGVTFGDDCGALLPRKVRNRLRLAQSRWPSTTDLVGRQQIFPARQRLPTAPNHLVHQLLIDDSYPTQTDEDR